MKAVVIMLAIVVIILILNICTVSYINDSSEKMLSYVQKARDAASVSDMEAIKKQVKDLRGEWEAAESKWEVLVDHREIDRIDTLMTHVEAMAAAGSLDSLIPELEELSFFINHIDDKHKIRAENIL